MAKLTPRQQRFIDEYMVDLNATQAAIRAGYSAKTARSQGQRLLTNVDVSAVIRERQEILQSATGLTVERIVQEYARIAFLDPVNLFTDDGSLIPLAEIDEDTRRAVASLDVSMVGGGEGKGTVKKIRLREVAPVV